MRRQLAIVTLLITLFSTALFVKIAYFSEADGSAAYAFISILWISGSLIAIFLANMIWQATTGPKSVPKAKAYRSWPNRRESFRIEYPDHIRPSLVLNRTDGCEARSLEYPVIDLSQQGCCFQNDGSLGAMKTFAGYIRLAGGRRVTVTGRFIREKANHVSVRFRQNITWSILLEEQRCIMSVLKPER
jgi:hypothetical protein